ncbi:Acg family FMN-binding oxidoreductase [Streptomyces sp. NPDC086023]|uniref:Acg family FMN-binding oxidoreductase n=1 Tax=Streptomyces sp. NPDC086023 TaxID=3365746 RepID=UPI0037D020AA
MVSTLPDLATVVALVEDAVRAPSMHNAQPWRFVLHHASGTLDLRGDPGRAAPHADPEHRALRLGCGAALFGLRVSAARAGLSCGVELLPDPADPWLFASARLSAGGAPEEDLAALHPALLARHTSRFPFRDEEVPEAIVDGLRAAALLEGCRLAVPDDWHTDTVLTLVQDAEHREDMDAGLRAETAAWMRGGGAGEADGVPSAAFGPGRSGPGAGVRDFGRAMHVPDRGWAVFERRPAIALLGTRGDGPADWLRAGQALHRVLLRATADGLVTSMTSQPLEWPELRPTVRDPLEGTGHVQMVIRYGYGPPGPASPRRPVAEVLEVLEGR